MILERPPYYRQSLIAAFDPCPRRALYSLQDERRTPGPAASSGTVLHRTLHRAIHILMEHEERQISPEQMMEIYADTLAQSEVPSNEVLPMTMKAMKWGRIPLMKWCMMMEITVGNIVAVEKRLSADIALPTGVTRTISGQLDLLLADGSEGAVILDHKTGFARPKQPREVSADGRGLTELGWVQSVIYAYLVFANYPSIQVVTFREWHLLWGEQREIRIERWESERFTDILAAQVALLDKAIEEGEDSPRWVPSAGPHCAMCANPRACPIREQVGIPVDDADARSLAQEWIVAGRKREERIPFLKGWVDAYGPIEVPYSGGRRFVGWNIAPDGKRSFGIFEPREIESPFDPMLAEAVRERGLLE